MTSHRLVPRKTTLDMEIWPTPQAHKTLHSGMMHGVMPNCFAPPLRKFWTPLSNQNHTQVRESTPFVSRTHICCITRQLRAYEFNKMS